MIFKYCEDIPISFSVEGHPKHIHVTKDEEERTTRERSEVTQMISITQKFLLVWWGSTDTDAALT